MNTDEHNSAIDDETVDPVVSAKAAYLAALSEHELLKPACSATGISIAQVWNWRAKDVWFDLEICRIWLKEEPWVWPKEESAVPITEVEAECTDTAIPITEVEVEYLAENAGAHDCNDTATSQCS